MPRSEFFEFLSDGVSVRSQRACGLKMIYLPLCGTDAASLKSSITPSLSGDSKIDKSRYVTKPASREDLRWPVRDFFMYVHAKRPRVVKACQESAPGTTTVEAGHFWQKVSRRHRQAGVELSCLNFIPVTGETMEIMQVTVTNISSKTIRVTPTAAIPIFGRALSNKHDHEHVTALLHRIDQVNEGVLVSPTMIFNEEGHREANDVYFVFGADQAGHGPTGSFPTVCSFYGEDGHLHEPAAVYRNERPQALSPRQRHGQEAVGALRFKDQNLAPGKSKTYVLAMGIASSKAQAAGWFKKINRPGGVESMLQDMHLFWFTKRSSIQVQTADPSFNAWMRWVTVQPVLRRIFGCSFLPDHDYGKGGKGWRDLWQDLLSLILIEPEQVRDTLIDNFAGVRIDGSNATIIGTQPGEFVADRNAITRVWMDHGCWPLLTLSLYIHQTGDFGILLQAQKYFRDPQMSRSFEKDWSANAREGGPWLKDHGGHIYQGTVIEHLLVQHLVQFFNVGEHNHVRLENADWNDGLDMAFQRGESVAFTSFYAGNLMDLAELLEQLAEHKQITTVTLAKELSLLLDTLHTPVDYASAAAKRQHLFKTYFPSVQPALSGEQVDIAIQPLAADLRKKAAWLFQHVRQREWMEVKVKGKTHHWFNGYYDNQARRVEGVIDRHVRMTLTGQVFPLMSGLAPDSDIPALIESVDTFLRDRQTGGYRLNTDFGLRAYLDLGRAFGFAYGTKENGAYFSHMNVMYAYALYKRGFVEAGSRVIESMHHMSMNSGQSKIFPGIPEYFDNDGRGMYHYLTGSASWMILTVLTQMFGLRGLGGDLIMDPKLRARQFDRGGVASSQFSFAGQRLQVEYHNPGKLEFGSYRIKEIIGPQGAVLWNVWGTTGARIPKAGIQTAGIYKVLLDGL